MNRTTIMSRIAKCLALSADTTTTQAERDTANKMAERLMLKYNINKLEATSKTEIENQEVYRNQAEALHNGMTDWELHLAGGICYAFDCESVFHRTIDGGQFTFLGLKEDLELVDYFFSFLQTLVEVATETDGGYATSKKAKNAFSRGMVDRINHRLKELYKYVQNNLPSDCKDLALVKKDVVQKKFNEVFPNTKQHKSTKVSQEELKAYYRGQKEGNSIDLSSNRIQVNV